MHKGIYAVLVSLLVVAGMMGTAVNKGGHHEKVKHLKLKTTRRTASSLCEGTRYKDACVNAFGASGNLTDPGQIVKVSFQVAKKALLDGISKSATINQAKADPRSAQALQICNETMTYALNDMERSVDTVGKLDNSRDINRFLEDLKVWMGGSLTYQQVCYDAFEGAKDTKPGMRIRHFFNASRELTSNALAMMNSAQQLASLFEVPSIEGSLTSFFGHRRLLGSDSDSDPADSGKLGSGPGLMPAWIKDAQRNLLTKPLSEIKPDAVVAQDGSGQYKTIQEALLKNPNVTTKPYIVYIKAGIYKESITVAKKQHNVFLVGDGPTKTVVTDSKNFVDGLPTYKTATAGFMGDGFMARDMGFVNSAGAEKHQAVAVRVVGDFSVFYNCQFDGFQDTLYSVRGRHFYRDCVIKGTIDFIFGDAQVIFQNCQMVIKKPMDNQACAVTAQGRTDPNGPGGIVLQNCTITADPAYTPAVMAVNKAYLGRPWKPYSRTIVMQSFIDSCIAPEGWEEWEGTKGINTLFYAEYQNRGPGSPVDKRVKWPGIQKLTAGQVAAFTPDGFFKGSEWIPPTGVPFSPGMLAGV